MAPLRAAAENPPRLLPPPGRCGAHHVGDEGGESVRGYGCRSRCGPVLDHAGASAGGTSIPPEARGTGSVCRCSPSLSVRCVRIGASIGSAGCPEHQRLTRISLRETTDVSGADGARRPPAAPGRRGSVPRMDLTFSERETAFRDELRAWLEANDPGAEPIDDTASYDWRRDWQRPPARGRLGRACTGRRSTAAAAPALTESAIFFEELGARPRAAARQRARPPAGRPDAHGLGHRRAEGALPRADPLRRGDLVPGLQRARGRLRPRRAEDARGARTATTGSSPARRCGPRGAQYSKWCMLVARTDHDAAEAQGPHLLPHGHGAGRRSRSGRCARSPARPSSTSSSSRTRGSRTRTSSAASATAGRSR